MSALWRILGFTLLGELAARLPARYARAASITLLLLANLLPVVGVLTGRMWVGEVFILFWLENVVVWLFTFIRILTATGPEADGRSAPVARRIGMALFFSVHFGLFTLGHGVFVFVIAGLYLARSSEAGDEAVPGGMAGAPFLWALVAMVLVQLVGLTVYWFGRDERRLATVQRTMFAPYPRMLVLHVVIIAAVPLSFVFPKAALPVLLLVGLRTVLDIGFFLRSRVAAESAAVGAERLSDAGATVG